MKKFTALILGSAFLLTACSQKVEKKEISIPFADQTITAQYTGTLEKGLPTGEGYFHVDGENGGWEYRGTFVNGAAADGTLTNAPFTAEIAGTNYDGLYTGSISNGLPDGNGTLSISEEGWGCKYSGYFDGGTAADDGLFNNFPLTAEFTGTEYDGLYTGSALNGLADGDGTFTYNKDKVEILYDGLWKENRPNGEGYLNDSAFLVIFSDGTNRIGYYNGETVDGQANGTGKFRAMTDDGYTYTYNGEWKNNLFHGYGVKEWEDETGNVYMGTYIEGEYCPEKSEYLQSLGRNNAPYYGLEVKNKDFIDNHKDFFPAADASALEPYIDTSVTYSMYTKKPSDFQERLIKLNNYRVLQIFEEDIDLDDIPVLTTLLVYNNSVTNFYYIYYFGKLDNIYQNDSVRIIGLPIAYNTYDNISGGQTWCIVLFGSSVTK